MQKKRKLMGTPSAQQRAFFISMAKHVAYGGARGGGKSWAMRRKFVLLALRRPGLQLLLLRRTLPELQENHGRPLQQELYDLANYNAGARSFHFPNGSRIRLGYCDKEADVYQYQGQEYDVIGLEEATHFTEAQMQFLCTCNRSTRADFRPRMYYTCNPGGVGHTWVKRLFIDRLYRGSERAEDYTFIQSLVYENKFLMEHSPEYVRTLENLPEERRKAMLHGDWDVFDGQYFSEFKRDLHVMRPFLIPKHWRRYVSLDYGLDMLACYWIALDEQENAYVYKELYESNLVVTQAAKRIAEMTTEQVYAYYAPPDLWNRHSDTGKSTAEIFAESGIMLVKAQNDRVQGWYNLHEWLRPYEDEQGKTTAHLKVFDNCRNLIRTLPALACDEKNPNDCAREPHELTHAPDAIRYFIAGRPLSAVPLVQEKERGRSWDMQVDEIVAYGR